MDEPLAASRKLNKTAGYAVEETAQFIALVRKNYPDWKVGDIEPYPSFPTPELMAYLDALQARLEEMHVRGLDFFRIDIDWMNFPLEGRQGQAAGRDGWHGVHALAEQIQKRHIPFSLIYWAADYPSLAKQGRATDETWEKGILKQGDWVRKAGITPDEYVIESWVHAPSHSIPETQKGTFMHSVLAFEKQNIR